MPAEAEGMSTWKDESFLSLGTRTHRKPLGRSRIALSVVFSSYLMGDFAVLVDDEFASVPEVKDDQLTGFGEDGVAALQGDALGDGKDLVSRPVSRLSTNYLYGGLCLFLGKKTLRRDERKSCQK